MCALAACSALGHSYEEIASTLITFSNNQGNSGRLNLYDVRGSGFIIDYGHNAHAIGTIARMLRRWPVERRTAVLGLPGDRSDEVLIAAAQAAAAGFDRIVVREDKDLLGRAPGELADILCRALHNTDPKVEVEVVLDELEAVRKVLAGCEAGDLIVAFCDQTGEVVHLLNSAGAVPLPGPDLLAARPPQRVKMPA